MLNLNPIELREYLTIDGRSPFSQWLRTLSDRRARAKIRVRLDRLEMGNPGDVRSAGSGVSELRIDYGPGYRIYYGRDGNTIVILLCGGTKKTQHQDISLAQTYWKDYKRRQNK